MFYLHQALISALKKGDEAGIDAYSQRALARIWKAMRFSWQMTTMLHQFEGEDSFAAQMAQGDAWPIWRTLKQRGATLRKTISVCRSRRASILRFASAVLRLPAR